MVADVVNILACFGGCLSTIFRMIECKIKIIIVIITFTFIFLLGSIFYPFFI